MREFYNNLLYMVLGITVTAIITGTNYQTLVLIGGIVAMLLLISKIIVIEFKTNQLITIRRSLLMILIPICATLFALMLLLKLICIIKMSGVSLIMFIALSSFLTFVLAVVLTVFYTMFKNYMKTLDL